MLRNTAQPAYTPETVYMARTLAHATAYPIGSAAHRASYRWLLNRLFEDAVPLAGTPVPVPVAPPLPLRPPRSLPARRRRPPPAYGNGGDAA